MKSIFTLVFIAFLTASTLGWSLDKTPSTNAVERVFKRIGVEEYDKLRAETNTLILDVRTPAEFKNGRVPGATNLDINSGDFTEKVAALDKNKTVLVNCAAGTRSAKASDKMKAMGFKKVYDLSPGFTGWKKAGKPVEK